MDHKFYRFRLLKQLLAETSKHKDVLLNELINNGTNHTVVTRRFRMIKELCEFEAQIIQKIYQFETTDPNDFDLSALTLSMAKILNRAA